ncbi:hypothetical protein [Neptuniibacter sp. QD37_11]|uniref:hypothetical protein n=1 Tax=Neptuniibacter sp. QD37_11 TaxID=3398209 RepID=UPI0039F626A2
MNKRFFAALALAMSAGSAMAHTSSSRHEYISPETASSLIQSVVVSVREELGKRDARIESLKERIKKLETAISKLEERKGE